MKTGFILHIIIILLLFTGCDKDSGEPVSGNPSQREMRFAFLHPGSAARATDTGFESGDCVSLFLKESSRPLEIAGNRITNECLTYDGSDWSFRMPFYWDKGVYDAIAIYPYIDEIYSVTDLGFEVSADQRAGLGENDLMYASVSNLEASDKPVSMIFRHMLSKLTVRLVKGEDYEGELPQSATVLVHNTVTRSTVDLEAGVATRESKADASTVTACKTGASTYAAILIPQRIDNRLPLIEVLAGDVSLVYESTFHFKPGVHHLINLVIERNPEQTHISIGGEMNEWGD